ncbi:hypothetical protein N7456_001165 [Penicillium angulare]|uniref:S-adenosyl-L-methionine-dependent methyltransferase n=1 Tax=Penicillium angulare TaxID=116970 RepID=A0A9W9GDK0_9EURO|nr:hypothetical protein N7456_001165 [Penicillium angulare]
MADEKPIAVDPDYYVARGEEYKRGDFESDTTSLSSSIYRGVIENGRRYQTMREGEYWSPADEKQFESYEAGHLVNVLLDSDTGNPLFQAPIKKPKHILDMGTGHGSWAVDAADMFPEAMVRGVDLFPPPVTWVPPNCMLEVDDVLKEWTWRQPFDLIHLRQMLGAFTVAEWDQVWKKCYDNLEPGGWIEQIEGSPFVRCDDGSAPKDNSTLYFGIKACEAADNWGHPLTLSDWMKGSLEKAGFVDIQEKTYKWPIGPWAKDPVLKEAGRLHYHQWLSGMEGWAMFFLTKWAVPEPWTKDEVAVLMAKVRKEVKNPNMHMYQVARRVWGRKPLAEEVMVRNIKKED